MAVKFKPILKRSAIISLVVGTTLNLINQYEAMMGYAPLQLWKMALTYAVPFVVSAYAAWSALRAVEKSGK